MNTKSITILHGDALVFYSTHVTAQLILPFRVFNKFALYAEAPHLL